jgi:outer membrane immunogenic protein
MRKWFIPGVLLLAGSASALAADLPLRRGAPAFEELPLFTWTGLYAGVNAGYGFSEFKDRDIGLPAGSVANSPATNGSLRVTGGSANEDGFIGGGQVGYNQQIGSVVIGLEADAQYKDFGRRRSSTGTYVFTGAPGAAFSPPSATLRFRNVSSEYFGTVRGRLGYAFDQVLIYGTGGLAYDSENIGWAAGGGVEYAFTSSLSAKIEGLYVSLGQDRGINAVYSGPAANILSLNDPNSGEFAVVRAGLNYRFNGF